MTSLYAQLEALTTSVAKLRREAPARAAETYAAELRRAIEGDDGDFGEDGDGESGVDEKGGSGSGEEGRAVNGDGDHANDGSNGESNNRTEGGDSRNDVDMPDAEPTTTTDQPAEDTKPTQRKPRSQQPPQRRTLDIPLGTDQEAERWRSGEMAEVYEDALRTLLRLQGEEENTQTALSSAVGKAERAGRAVEVVEKP